MQHGYERLVRTGKLGQNRSRETAWCLFIVSHFSEEEVEAEDPEIDVEAAEIKGPGLPEDYFGWHLYIFIFIIIYIVLIIFYVYISIYFWPYPFLGWQAPEICHNIFQYWTPPVNLKPVTWSMTGHSWESCGACLDRFETTTGIRVEVPRLRGVKNPDSISQVGCYKKCAYCIWYL